MPASDRAPVAPIPARIMSRRVTPSRNFEWRRVMGGYFHDNRR